MDSSGSPTPAQKLHGSEGTDNTGLCGRLDPVWHARDTECPHHRSSCITPLSICNPGTQRRTVMLTSTTPSTRYGLPWSVLQMPPRIKSSLPRTQANQYKMLCTQIRRACESVYARGTPPKEHLSPPEQQTVSWYDCFALGDRPFQETVTDVVSTEVLDYLPDEDVPWVLDELFRSARRKVAVTVRTATRTSVLDHGIDVSHRPRPESWWVAQLEAAGCRYPERHWQQPCIRAMSGARVTSRLRRRPSL